MRRSKLPKFVPVLRRAEARASALPRAHRFNAALYAFGLMGLGLIAAEVRQNAGGDRQVRSLPRLVTETTQAKPVGSTSPGPVQEATPASPTDPLVSATDGGLGAGLSTAGAPGPVTPAGGTDVVTETVTFETVEVPGETPAGPAAPEPPDNLVDPGPLSLVPPAAVPALPRPGQGSFNALPDGSPIGPGPGIPPLPDLDLAEPSEPSGPTFSDP